VVAGFLYSGRVRDRFNSTRVLCVAIENKTGRELESLIGRIRHGGTKKAEAEKFWSIVPGEGGR